MRAVLKSTASAIPELNRFLVDQSGRHFLIHPYQIFSAAVLLAPDRQLQRLDSHLCLKYLDIKIIAEEET
jgi:hypothetical protein